MRDSSGREYTCDVCGAAGRAEGPGYGVPRWTAVDLDHLNEEGFSLHIHSLDLCEACTKGLMLYLGVK